MPIGINYSVLYVLYVLHINGKRYAKENKDLYRFGLQGWLYSNNQITYQAQPKVIAECNNHSSYIKQFLHNLAFSCHTI